MSKPWFLKMTMEAEPSPLAGVIANVLKQGPEEAASLPPSVPEKTVVPEDSHRTIPVYAPHIEVPEAIERALSPVEPAH